MRRRVFLLGGLAFSTVVFAQTAKTPIPVESRRALVNQYCAGCHNDKLRTGGFSWTQIDLAHPEQNAELTEKVIRKLRVGMMPPAGMPKPSRAERNAFASALESALDKAAAGHMNAGAPDLHRLNRTEYRNSVRDLLDLDVDVAALLPPDDMSHGFDNMADALTVTPVLMQSYIRAADKISRLAIGDPQASPVMAKYDVPKVYNQMRHVDGAPFGTRGGISVMHNFPADGDYTFKSILYYYYTEELFGSALPKPLQGQQIEVSVDGSRVALFTIDPLTPERVANYVTPPVRVTAGPHRVSAAFLSKFDGPIEDSYRLVEQTLLDVSIGLEPGMTSLPQLHTLLITGPLKVSGVSDTPSRRKVFVCRPSTESEELPCAKKIIAGLARQAYRRPVNDTDIEHLLNYYQAGRNDADFDSGVRAAIQAMLADPQFVFRFERVPPRAAPGSNFRISDLELASRLSYFLWSSAPDEELLKVASEGKLREKEVLANEVRRMLADPRSEALSRNFASQWLHLQNLKEISPDGNLFPNYTKNLSLAMTNETELLFDSIMREDRNVLDLLTAKYTFVNEILAKHYGIPDIVGNRMRRVALTDPNRYGILGQGSFLMLTSIANRTSPVQRGKYVMEVLLGSPPPPPPPNVPALKENLAVNEKPLSVRERMEQHRENEPCHTCHQMMDPIGLALENFDAVGVWREKDSGSLIDASGRMFDGSKLDGPVSLRNAILNHSDSFLGTFAENLLAYGLGRVIDYRDMPVVRSIEQSAAKNGDRFSSFIFGVVDSTPFQMRKVRQSSGSEDLASAKPAPASQSNSKGERR